MSWITLGFTTSTVDVNAATFALTGAGTPLDGQAFGKITTINAGIAADTPLGVLNDGAGVTTTPSGTTDIGLDTISGNNYTIDLSTVVTVQDFIDLVDTSTSNEVTVTISMDSLALILTDNTMGGGSFGATAENGSSALADLRLDNGAMGNVITGDDFYASTSAALTVDAGAVAVNTNDVDKIRRVWFDYRIDETDPTTGFVTQAFPNRSLTDGARYHSVPMSVSFDADGDKTVNWSFVSIRPPNPIVVTNTLTDQAVYTLFSQLRVVWDDGVNTIVRADDNSNTWHQSTFIL